MDYHQLADFRNTHNPYAQKLGIFVEEIRAGYARATKVITAEDLNPTGFPHGGIYLSLSDTVCGSAAASYGGTSVTVTADYHFLHSARLGDSLTAEATEIHEGNVIRTFDVQIKNSQGKLLGAGTFTMYQL